jgi:hypothetical protein
MGRSEALNGEVFVEAKNNELLDAAKYAVHALDAFGWEYEEVGNAFKALVVAIRKAETTKAETHLNHIRTLRAALLHLPRQNRMRGYPTGAEWAALLKIGGRGFGENQVTMPSIDLQSLEDFSYAVALNHAKAGLFESKVNLAAGAKQTTGLPIYIGVDSEGSASAFTPTNAAELDLVKALFLTLKVETVITLVPPNAALNASHEI